MVNTGTSRIYIYWRSEMEGFYWPFFDPFLDWLSDWERGIDLKVVDKKGERCIVEL